MSAYSKLYMDFPIKINAYPKPFLKWAGGKRQLLPNLLLEIDKLQNIKSYHEPFLGGGALYFELRRLNYLKFKAYLSDTNEELINCYMGIKTEVEKIITLLNYHKRHHSEIYFYKIRGNQCKTKASRAARFIYLNKTCYNGLYRVNKSGQFNVPHGRHINPTICDKQNILSVSETLQNAEISTANFQKIPEHCKKGDLVYFDPPYMPISSTSDFTSYTKLGFTYHDQVKLSGIYKRLSDKGVYVILSNSQSTLIRELYSDYRITNVMASRLVNSISSRRGKISEILVCNF